MRLIDADEFLEKAKIVCDSEPELYEKVSNYFENLPTIEPEPDLPPKPIQCAAMLIERSFEYETSTVQRAFGAGEKVHASYYSVDELRQIAEHLLVYCNHMESEDD